MDWGEDVSDAAVQQRMEALTGAAKCMTVSDDVEKTPQERINLFYEFLKVDNVGSFFLGGLVFTRIML